MNRFLHVAAALFVCFGLSSATFAQSIQMSDLPGWDRVQHASKQMQSIKVVRPVIQRWDPESARLYFQIAEKDQQKVNRVVDLSTGEITDVADTPKESSPQETGNRGRRRPGVARARQRSSIRSEDGKWKASYKDYNMILQAIDAEGNAKGEPIQVTKGGSEKHRFGTACWVYGEELDQNDAMWFSPDSSKLAFYEIDESHMKTYFLTTGNAQLYTNVHKEQYPTAGQDNPHVALHIYDLASKKTVKVQLDGPIDQYLYGIRFSPDGGELLFHRTNRWQNELDVLAANLTTGETRTVVTETQETWQDNSPLMQFLDDGKRFIWETEQSGWKQFQLRHINGTKICDLTRKAEYPVSRVVKVDEKNGWFYYSAYSDDNPLNLQLHRSRLDGSDSQRLTSDSFSYSGFQISPDNEYFVANYETISNPPSTGVWKIETMSGEKIVDLARSEEKAVQQAGFVPGELFSFKADDGETDIYGTLYKPRDFDPSKKYPLLIDVYGGPHSVGVTNRYRAANTYCELGFLIAKIGNRGTVNRGKAFESANYLKLGIVDMDDQAAGVRHLTQRDYVDGTRVGISGHSYGGYMSALALLRYPKIFQVGVAGAPVTDWKNYDTIYTERYMRTPEKNKAGYEDGSCLKKEHINNLNGKLFILHGLVDDNVHPSNTWQLVDKLATGWQTI